MSYSFNTTANSSQSSIKPRLNGNQIHDVQFDGCEIIDIKGVKNPNEVYKVLKLRFSNDEGTYEHTVFEPREQDFTRGETKFADKNTGEEKSIPQPSGVENMMLLFKHAIDIINPEVAKQIDSGTKNLGAKDWDSLRKLVQQILDVGKGTKFQIKLLITSKGEAAFPGFFSGISKEGKVYVRNNFIGKKLGFSAYETTRINNAAKARPAEVKPFDAVSQYNDLPPATSGGLDIDFDLPQL